MHPRRIPKQCIVEKWNVRNPRERAASHSTNHEDQIAVKGFTSMSQYNVVCKIIPMPQAMKIPNAKAAVDKEWEKLETTPAWQWEKVKSKLEVSLEAQREKKKVHFASLGMISLSVDPF